MTTPTTMSQMYHQQAVNTPSESSTAMNFQLMQQLQQQQSILMNMSGDDKQSTSCMKSTQAAALSSLMFTTPQRVTYFQQHRHLYFHHEEFTKSRRKFVKQWRAKDEVKSLQMLLYIQYIYTISTHCPFLY